MRMPKLLAPPRSPFRIEHQGLARIAPAGPSWPFEAKLMRRSVEGTMGPSCRPPARPVSTYAGLSPRSGRHPDVFARGALGRERGWAFSRSESPMQRAGRRWAPGAARPRPWLRPAMRAKGAWARWVWTQGLYARGYESALKDADNTKSPGPGQGAQSSNALWGTGEAAAAVAYMRHISYMSASKQAKETLQASSNRALCARRLLASWPLSRRGFLLPVARSFALADPRASSERGFGYLGFRDVGHAALAS